MTYLEFLSLLVLYMAWVVLLLRMILADRSSSLNDEPRGRKLPGSAPFRR